MLIEAKDKNAWNQFILTQPHAPFTQSWEWGEFQKNADRKIWRLVVTSESNEFCGIVQAIQYPLPLGKSFLYVPRGPIVKKDSSRIISEIIHHIKLLAKKEGAIFARIDSLTDKKMGLQPAPAEAYRSAITQPKTEWMVDISQTEEDLLKAMHEKTRYNIRLSQKKGVVTQFFTGTELKKQLNDFLMLLGETAVRDQFYLHPVRHYETLIQAFHEHVELVTAKFQGKTLATGLILFFGDTATYLYGGSSSENRNLMAPYAMHWEAIKRAKGRGLVSPKLGEGGCRYYSFGGINDTDLAGVTRFKQGFGGEAVDFPGSFDMIVNPMWYWLYNTTRRLRR